MLRIFQTGVIIVILQFLCLLIRVDNFHCMVRFHIKIFFFLLFTSLPPCIQTHLTISLIIIHAVQACILSHLQPAETRSATGLDRIRTCKLQLHAACLCTNGSALSCATDHIHGTISPTCFTIRFGAGTKSTLCKAGAAGNSVATPAALTGSGAGRATGTVVHVQRIVEGLEIKDHFSTRRSCHGSLAVVGIAATRILRHCDLAAVVHGEFVVVRGNCGDVLDGVLVVLVGVQTLHNSSCNPRRVSNKASIVLHIRPAKEFDGRHIPEGLNVGGAWILGTCRIGGPTASSTPVYDCRSTGEGRRCSLFLGQELLAKGGLPAILRACHLTADVVWHRLEFSFHPKLSYQAVTTFIETTRGGTMGSSRPEEGALLIVFATLLAICRFHRLSL
mmetsp:Transcript_6968/g.12098  ORF Transcript_6968/g.12098 Transcript_6968/m.12098 type:complete len:390 (-) Transcript_6968:2223-3392(-)